MKKTITDTTRFNKKLIMPLLIACFFVGMNSILSSCNKNVAEKNICNQCTDSARLFYLESQNQLQTSFYLNKRQFNRLKFILHSNCNDTLVGKAGYYIFFSYIVKTVLDKPVNLSMSQLTIEERNEALQALHKASRINIASCNYILGLFYLNGYYVNKDIKKGMQLLGKCKDFDKIEEDLFYHNINTKNVDSLYSIPTKFKLNQENSH